MSHSSFALVKSISLSGMVGCGTSVIHTEIKENQKGIKKILRMIL